MLIRHAVSDVDLRTDLDSSSRRYMKISAGIVRGPGQTDKQFVLPVGHFRCFGWPRCTPGQKERCTHHVELEAVCPTGCQANRDVWTFHISKRMTTLVKVSDSRSRVIRSLSATRGIS